MLLFPRQRNSALQRGEELASPRAFQLYLGLLCGSQGHGRSQSWPLGYVLEGLRLGQVWLPRGHGSGSRWRRGNPGASEARGQAPSLDSGESGWLQVSGSSVFWFWFCRHRVVNVAKLRHCPHTLLACPFLAAVCQLGILTGLGSLKYSRGYYRVENLAGRAATNEIRLQTSPFPFCARMRS